MLSFVSGAVDSKHPDWIGVYRARALSAGQASPPPPMVQLPGQVGWADLTGKVDTGRCVQWGRLELRCQVSVKQRLAPCGTEIDNLASYWLGHHLL